MLLASLLFLLILISAYRSRIQFYNWYIGFPAPEYKIVCERNIMLPMRDGVKLATDVYRPNCPGRYPAIIARTPYSKSGKVHPYRKLGQIYASQGFVFIVQDVRGKYNSDGEFSPYAHEAEDGDTVVSWAGKAKWSNGKVALFGFSYLGSCAWLAAKHQSPYLQAIVPMFTNQNCYSVWCDQGIPYLKGPLYWLSRYSEKKENWKITNKKTVKVLWKLPLIELDAKLTKKTIKAFRDYLAHPIPHPYWEKLSVHHLVDQINVPAFIVGGWYDPYLKGTIDDFLRMSASTSEKNRLSCLCIGPWAHNPMQKFRGLNFGKEANFNKLLLENLNWCKSWLAEEKNYTFPKVRYFLMGKNEWRSAGEWPPKEARHQKYFLRHKPFELSEVEGVETQEESYIYDPLKPVSFRGDYLMHTNRWFGPFEQSEFKNRDDLFIYHSPPFEKELTIAGPVKLVLFVSSTAPDTDFFAKICDMRPDGKAYNLQNGVLRMRFRKSFEKAEMMNQGEIYRVEICLKSIANTFLKGHRLQLQITSSDFPTHGRNLNTGLNSEMTEKVKIAKQTIYTGGHFNSHLLLPVLREL